MERTFDEQENVLKLDSALGYAGFSGRRLQQSWASSIGAYTTHTTRQKDVHGFNDSLQMASVLPKKYSAIEKTVNMHPTANSSCVHIYTHILNILNHSVYQSVFGSSLIHNLKTHTVRCSIQITGVTFFSSPKFQTNSGAQPASWAVTLSTRVHQV